MEEFKSVSFVFIGKDGKPHRACFDKVDHEHPNFTLIGDPALLLQQWEAASKRIEMFLRGQRK